MRRRWPNTLVLGMAFLVLAPSALASDSSTAPSALGYGTPEQANTSGYGVQPGEQNTTAPFTQQCNSGHNVGVARTAWYRIRGNGHRVVVTTEGSNYDTALFVYGDSAAGPLADCNDDLSGSDLQSSLSVDTVRGKTYAIQIGRACNETGPPVCATNPPAGSLRVIARDVEATPRLSIRSSFSVRFFRRYTRFTSLNVSGAPAGSKLVISCKSRKRGCPFKKITRKITKRRTIRLGRKLRRARLKPKARLTIRVTKPGFIGWLRTYTVRKGKLPKKRTYCMRPGSTRPRRHCG